MHDDVMRKRNVSCEEVRIVNGVTCHNRFLFFFSDEVYLIYNVLLASRIQRNGSVIYI